MRYFLFAGAYHEAGDGEALPADAVEVPRLPGPGEHWDGKAFVVDDALAADLAAPAGHIDRAHLIKTVEAALVLSGTKLTHGLLAAESTATGVPIATLAAEVASKESAFVSAEIDRRKRKLAARAKP